jgi:serine protease
MQRRIPILVLLMVAVTVGVSGRANAGLEQPGPFQLDPAARPTRQIIIKFNDLAADSAMQSGAEATVLDQLSLAAGEELAYVRPMSGGAHVLALPDYQSPDDVAAISARLTELADVDYAEPDLVRGIGRGTVLTPAVTELNPNDTRFGDQWHYKHVPGTAEGINLPPAWAITTGSSSTVVAVVDTGILSHADLAGRIAPGYDFITSPTTANDGGGRDGDASDPGDWIAANECGFTHSARNSSWHGTHVAGTIGAATNNSLGVSGVNWQTKILPVRVLGKCGGITSDIVDGIRWAAGLHVPGAPANKNPADVINLSLGGSGPCMASEKAAFADVKAAGTTVVIAAGNSASDAVNYSPANCENTITVAATDRGGDRAYYSNFGNIVEVSAPGGETNSQAGNGVLSTWNTGATAPASDSYVFYQGTSMAAPHVAGLVSLMIARDPTLTPNEIVSTLQNTARAFPAGSDCSTSRCGAGIVDAQRAINPIDPVIYGNQVYLPSVVTPSVAPEISFGSATYNVVESGGNVSLTISLNGPTNQTVSVEYTTGNLSAAAGSDYVAKSAKVIFSPGQVSKKVNITILDDGKLETPEKFLVYLKRPQGAALSTPSTATVVIHDDDVSSDGIANGDFEAGSTGWTEYSFLKFDLILERAGLPIPPHNGNWAVWLGGANAEVAYVEQTASIPAGSPYLTYWHWINSEDVECGWDHGIVVVNGNKIADHYDLCVTQDTGGWVKYSADLSPWAGQTVAVQIRIQTDNLYTSNLFVDGVTFTATPAPSATTQTGPQPTLWNGGPATDATSRK